MNFIETLHQKLTPWNLLSHRFYMAWSKGGLSLSTLQTYAREYYTHVAAFPRYISAIHSHCPDLKMRQVLLGNLIEEEQGDENHPELWQRFGEGLGIKREDMTLEPHLKATKDLVEGYFGLTSDFATGLGALYAYERQTPGVSKSKIEGLKKFYNLCDERSLQFFEVHARVDEWHTQECADLLLKLDKNDQNKAAQGAEMGAKLLWNFLDGMMVVHEC